MRALAILQQRFQVANAALKSLCKRAGFVFGGRRQNKILWSVVIADAVDVMDVLVPLQSASENSFHDGAVLQPALAWACGDNHVTIARDSSPSFPQRMLCAVWHLVVVLFPHLNAMIVQPDTHSCFCDSYSRGDLGKRQAGFVHSNQIGERGDAGLEWAVRGSESHASPTQSLPHGGGVHANGLTDLLARHAGFVKGRQRFSWHSRNRAEAIVSLMLDMRHTAIIAGRT